MKSTRLFFIGLLFCVISSYAQRRNDTPLQKKEKEPAKKFMLIGQDSMIVSEIELEEVIVLQKLDFKNKKELRRYLVLKRKTKKVWPYAVLAAER
jgi:hypothetical protein